MNLPAAKRFCSTLLLLWMAGVTVSHAATAVIFEGVSTKAIGITGLDLGGTLYDVDFIHVAGTVPDPITVDPCDDPGGSGVQCDLFVPFADPSTGDQSGAEAAAAAINVALNSESAESVGPAGGASDTRYLVPFETCTSSTGNDPAICGNRGRLEPFDDQWHNTVDSVTEIFTDSGDAIFAKFTPASAVPLPPAAVLFASGLIILFRRSSAGRRRSSA